MTPPGTRSANDALGLNAQEEDAVVLAYNRTVRLGHWLPRVGAAAILLFHAVGHLEDIDAFAAMFGLSQGIAWAAALAEFAAGILLVVGALPSVYADIATRLGGFLVIPPMIGAIVEVHWPRWSFVPDADAGFPMGGMEFQLLLAAVGLYFVLRGNPEGVPPAGDESG